MPPFPPLLSLLDAIHLATALLTPLQVEDLRFATHDGELGTAARAIGFAVFGVARLYIAASFAGSGQPPNWYRNLLAHPNVAVETRRSRGRYSARIADAAEAAALWPRLDAIYPTFAKYRTRTRRVIHIVELTPIPDH